MRGNGTIVGQRRLRSSIWTRGAAVRTFRGLALFAALALLGGGGCLMEQQFADPLNAESVALMLAAVLIATGTILAGTLVLAMGRTRLRSKPPGRSGEILVVKPISINRRQLEWNSKDKDVSIPCRYVDHARIRQ